MYNQGGSKWNGHLGQIFLLVQAVTYNKPPVTWLATNNSKKWLTTYEVWVIHDLIIPSCIILYYTVLLILQYILFNYLRLRLNNRLQFIRLYSIVYRNVLSYIIYLYLVILWYYVIFMSKLFYTILCIYLMLYYTVYLYYAIWCYYI